mgnify:CR=1 FL=1|tara:strand:- start:3108 stop:3329 length:222 start_codon:yes stop_codon:yes gene_type:complete
MQIKIENIDEKMLDKLAMSIQRKGYSMLQKKDSKYKVKNINKEDQQFLCSFVAQFCDLNDLEYTIEIENEEDY